MDLVQSLAGQLGIPADQAQAVAGGVLSFVKGQLGSEDAAQVDAAIPELGGWEQALASSTSSGGGFAGVMGGLLGQATGDPKTAALVATLGQLGLDPAMLQTIVPIVLPFLEERLPPGLLDKATAVLPLLSGGEGAAASALGALGGFFK